MHQTRTTPNNILIVIKKKDAITDTYKHIGMDKLMGITIYKERGVERSKRERGVLRGRTPAGENPCGGEPLLISYI